MGKCPAIIICFSDCINSLIWKHINLYLHDISTGWQRNYRQVDSIEGTEMSDFHLTET